MRYLRYLFLLVLAIVLLVGAMANRQIVTLTLLPEELAVFSGLAWDIRLPLFAVMLAGIAIGLLIGFVWEWLREHRLRSERARAKRDASKLEREVKRLKRDTGEGQDDVLALLEDGGKAS